MFAPESVKTQKLSLQTWSKKQRHQLSVVYRTYWRTLKARLTTFTEKGLTFVSDFVSTGVRWWGNWGRQPKQIWKPLTYAFLPSSSCSFCLLFFSLDAQQFSHKVSWAPFYRQPSSIVRSLSYKFKTYHLCLTCEEQNWVSLFCVVLWYQRRGMELNPSDKLGSSVCVLM